MKNPFSTVGKLVAAAVCALSLGSCARADYALLPKGASYHGVGRAATPVPVAPVASSVRPDVATAPTAPEAATTAPAAASAEQLAAASAAAAQATTAENPAAPAVRKPTLAQRVALNRINHKLDKLMKKSGAVSKHDNTASTAKGNISGNLRIGIILLLIGLLVGLLNGFVGGIIAIIGLIFIVLWLLDQV